MTVAQFEVSPLIRSESDTFERRYTPAEVVDRYEGLRAVSGDAYGLLQSQVIQFVDFQTTSFETYKELGDPTSDESKALLSHVAELEKYIKANIAFQIDQNIVYKDAPKDERLVTYLANLYFTESTHTYRTYGADPSVFLPHTVEPDEAVAAQPHPAHITEVATESLSEDTLSIATRFEEMIEGIKQRAHKFGGAALGIITGSTFVSGEIPLPTQPTDAKRLRAELELHRPQPARFL